MKRIDSLDNYKEIGKEIGEAFFNEEGMFPYYFSYEEVIAYFTIVVKTMIQSKCLYTINDKGYIAYWSKKRHPRITLFILMNLRILRSINWRHYTRFISGMSYWKDNETQYMNENDYITVFMLVVKREYQGQGYMKQLLEEPFTLAREKRIPCILDTDSSLKCMKYTHCGMHIVKHQTLKNGLDMYTLEYKGE